MEETTGVEEEVVSDKFDALAALENEAVNIVRFCYGPMGTFGRLRYKDFHCYTVERPWWWNEPYVSCIPAGIYPMKLGIYNRGGYPAFEILRVPGRSLIKIHVANTVDDVFGCVGLGDGLGFVNDRWAVTHSKGAFKKFMAAVGDQPEILINVQSLFTDGEWGMPKDGGIV